LKLVLSVNKRLNREVAVRTINPFHHSWKYWYFTDWYLYIKSNNPCLFVCMSYHCSGTPKPICLKFWLRNSVDPRKCSQFGLKVEWRELFYRSLFQAELGSKASNTENNRVYIFLKIHIHPPAPISGKTFLFPHL